MNLKIVTITGADDSTHIPDLVALSDEYPFVEWGILMSLRQEGGPRFPSLAWIKAFSGAAASNHVKVSAHLCGAWTRRLLIGELVWNETPLYFLGETAARIQINTHAEKLVSTTRMLTNMDERRNAQFIFQFDGVNDHLIHAAQDHHLNVAALFDKSGGAGEEPTEWPMSRCSKFPCGYAGGLGPENILKHLAVIESVCGGCSYWIDMERNVRTPDDSRLNMAAVRQVLQQCAELMKDGQ